MGLAIYGARNISVENLRIQETGGDGIYVGNIEGGLIRNVVCVCLPARPPARPPARRRTRG